MHACGEIRGFSHCPEIYSPLPTGKLVQPAVGQAKLEHCMHSPRSLTYREKKKKKMTDRPLTHTLSGELQIFLAHSPQAEAGCPTGEHFLLCQSPYPSPRWSHPPARSFVPHCLNSLLTLSGSGTLSFLDAEKPKSRPLVHSVHLCPGLGFSLANLGLELPEPQGCVADTGIHTFFPSKVQECSALTIP